MPGKKKYCLNDNTWQTQVHVREIEAQGDAVAEELIDIAVAQEVVSSQHDDEQEQVGKNKIPFRLFITRPQINTEECKHDDYDIHNKLYSVHL